MIFLHVPAFKTLYVKAKMSMLQQPVLSVLFGIPSKEGLQQQQKMIEKTSFSFVK